MAHHQRHSHEIVLAAQGLSLGNPSGSARTSIPAEEESASDLDEPPDSGIHFAKLVTPSSRSFNTNSVYDYMSPSDQPQDRKESLLTQALLSSPDLNPLSDAEAPVLTSDGGLTSPARTTTPSPPPPMVHTGIAMSHSPENMSDTVRIAPTAGSTATEETSVEAGLGRKRCISFACGRQSAPQKGGERPVQSPDVTETPAKAANPTKRPCMLRFACPMKPSRTEHQTLAVGERLSSPSKDDTLFVRDTSVGKTPETAIRKHRDSDSTITNSPSQCISLAASKPQSRKGKVFNRVDFQKSEATRFHEFAGHFDTEDEWTNEQTAYRHKITVNDTLRKENAIRRLADEAEDEALEEEAEEQVTDHEDDDDDDGDEELTGHNEDALFDDGNETDDEEGFAESDDSDDESNYQFWTPGLTTAATSADHLEHIRPMTQRVASDSSIESIINTKPNHPAMPEKHHARFPRVRPGTPELPDSSDFVVGTIDEDRPLEEAYLSCLEERRRSKHKLIPQDIDPSFPTSDPEADKDYQENSDDEEQEAEDAIHVDDGREWVMGRQETSEDGKNLPSKKGSPALQMRKPSAHHAKHGQSSPMKRLESPPPKRTLAHLSPAPRRLFGQTTRRLRSPPPLHRKISSPPSSRRPSIDGSARSPANGIDMPRLAQRPNLTHTTSLPRTPNPFWSQHRKARTTGHETPSAGTSPRTVRPRRMNIHSRGPIDIVQGLETKRQRRKDKFWRQHCRAAGKEKERKCQPGKGAERMKELGLEMADRFRGYGQRAQLVLSV